VIIDKKENVLNQKRKQALLKMRSLNQNAHTDKKPFAIIFKPETMEDKL